MADGTHIEWTDATWNPTVGCEIVSPGCTNCYAMRMAARIEAAGTAPYYSGLTKRVKGIPVWTGLLRDAPEHVLTRPLSWRKPRRIFVNSMSDLFAEGVSDQTIGRVFAVMALAPQHTFQVLTKRPERMRQFITEPFVGEWLAGSGLNHPGATREALASLLKLDLFAKPLPNVWLGVSAEDQARADERIPVLLNTPAAVRFLSAEPLLGMIDLNGLPDTKGDPSWDATALHGLRECAFGDVVQREEIAKLDWVIVGGESGPGARPMHPEWARLIREDCARAGVAFHFKQWGSWAATQSNDGDWPTNADGFCRLQVSGARGDAGWPMQRVGKAFAGRLLDGRTHDEFPEVRP